MAILRGVEPIKSRVFENSEMGLKNENYHTFLWYARNEHNLRTVVAARVYEEHHRNTYIEPDATDDAFYDRD